MSLEDQYVGDDNQIDLESYSDRHPSTVHMLAMINPNPKLTGAPAVISYYTALHAITMVENIKDSPELTAGLRKLLESKDCFVRASLDLNPVDYRDR